MQNYVIFCHFRSKLAITHTIVIKWKEKYNAVVVDCHHSLRLCGDRMKMSLPKKKLFFLGGGWGGGGGGWKLRLLPWSHLGQKMWP